MQKTGRDGADVTYIIKKNAGLIHDTILLRAMTSPNVRTISRLLKSIDMGYLYAAHSTGLDLGLRLNIQCLIR